MRSQYSLIYFAQNNYEVVTIRDYDWLSSAWASNKMQFTWAFKTRVRVSRASKNNWLASKRHRPAEYEEKLPTTSQGIVPFTTGGHLECVLWEFRQPNTHSEPVNKPLVDEIMDFLDVIYRSNNYVENLYATGNNEKKKV